MDVNEFRDEIIKTMKLKKTEKFSTENGNKHVVKYYEIAFQSSKHADLIKNNLRKDASLAKSDGPVMIPPGIDDPPQCEIDEQLLRIDIEFSGLNFEGRFDTATGYQNDLENERFIKGFEIVTGEFVSNPVYNLLTGSVLETVKSGAEGNTDATSYDRVVSKNAQVCTKSGWKTYFISNQKEVYWAHDQRATDTNSGNVYTDYQQYFPSVYHPIHWIQNTWFEDEETLLEIAYERYRRGEGVGYDKIEDEYYKSIWNLTPGYNY
ncbi:hypothetical protein ACFQWC_00020 [Rossellomorea sp. GCM10028870]|uniref:hypothetical protein n=1 Tax=Rossellomorea sp. GCM10028870 TaxID=3273426 RepID=UPI003620FAD7